MNLAGKLYDFGEGKIGDHLRAISDELNEQAYINGEDEPGLCEAQPLYDLSELLQRLAVEVAKSESK